MGDRIIIQKVETADVVVDSRRFEAKIDFRIYRIVVINIKRYIAIIGGIYFSASIIGDVCKRFYTNGDVVFGLNSDDICVFRLNQNTCIQNFFFLTGAKYKKQEHCKWKDSGFYNFHILAIDLAAKCLPPSMNNYASQSEKRMEGEFCF